jgi:hypothetical protein
MKCEKCSVDKSELPPSMRWLWVHCMGRAEIIAERSKVKRECLTPWNGTIWSRPSQKICDPPASRRIGLEDWLPHPVKIFEDKNLKRQCLGSGQSQNWAAEPLVIFNSIQFFIIYVLSQQPQDLLQTQHSVKKSNYMLDKNNINSKHN